MPDGASDREAITIIQVRKNEVLKPGHGSGMRDGAGLCLISTSFHSLIFGNFVFVTVKVFLSIFCFLLSVG